MKDGGNLRVIKLDLFGLIQYMGAKSLYILDVIMVIGLFKKIYFTVG